MIVKGWLGFGDRLQCLKMCVKYAQEKKRKIYVDWSDSIWSHGSESFYSYFKLEMPTFDISEIPSHASVYPGFWKGKLDVPLDEKTALLPEINTGALKDNYSEDVLVYSCVSIRDIYPDSTFFIDVFKVVHPDIISVVRQRIEKYKLSNKIGIHLRGTDRANRTDKQHRIAGMNVRMLSAGMLNGQDFVAVSDDPDYIQAWKSRYSYPVLTEVGCLGGREGVHNKKAEQLSVSKDSLNIDSLIDFFTLAACKAIITTVPDSRFAQEATRLKRMSI
jgi:hypothetical protein